MVRKFILALAKLTYIFVIGDLNNGQETKKNN